jgi:hypothetical protein
MRTKSVPKVPRGGLVSFLPYCHQEFTITGGATGYARPTAMVDLNHKMGGLSRCIYSQVHTYGRTVMINMFSLAFVSPILLTNTLIPPCDPRSHGTTSSSAMTDTDEETDPTESDGRPLVFVPLVVTEFAGIDHVHRRHGR